MVTFLPAELLAKPFGKLLQWLDEHHVFLILPLSGVLLAAGMFGYAHFRTPPVPEPFTLEAEAGDYCYVDVQLLSPWLLKTTGSTADQFYLAVGADEALCILSMNDVLYEDFAVIARYSDTGADDPDHVPAPYRAAGTVRQMTRENMDLLIESLDTTEEQYMALLGDHYLDLRDDPTDDLLEAAVYILGASLLLLVIDAIVIFDDRREQRKQRRTTAPEE